MGSLRRVGALLFLGGLIVGTLVDSTPIRQPRRVADYWILSADFHVHAFPGDGGLLPSMLRTEARYAGLDVFAIANHNQTFAARLARPGAHDADGPIVIVGSEITNPRFHVIAIGIDDPVDWNQPAADVIEAVHRQGGVAIAAHPARAYWSGWDDRAVALLDGVEVAHPARHVNPGPARDFDAFHRRARGHNPRVAAIGSSDFHASPSMAHCRTYVFARELSEDAVLEAIRQGRTIAEDGDGRMYGPSELVRLVEANRPPGRSDPHAGWRRLSIACAWFGLVGLLLFRPGSRRS